MRVIAGEYKGRKLSAPKGDSVRPTAGRVKEALFSMLSDSVRGARALDVFAGTGSLGIEALSRGAASCLFFENSREAASALRANLDALKVGGEAQVEYADFRTAMARRSGYEADIVFVDPPYGSGFYEETMQSLIRYDMIKSGGIAALESSDGGADREAYPNFVMRKKKRYGKTYIRFYERTERD